MYYARNLIFAAKRSLVQISVGGKTPAQEYNPTAGLWGHALELLRKGHKHENSRYFANYARTRPVRDGACLRQLQ